MDSIILSGLTIALENKLINQHALVITDNRIAAIIPEPMIEHHLPAQHYRFPNNYTLSPGLIDLHIHGANGFDVMDGTKKALSAIALALAEEGVTGFLATTMSAEKDQITDVMKTIAEYDNEKGAKILGIHLEGPFLAPHKAGAQLERVLLPPDINLFHHWQHTANNQIKLVTLAPELEEALTFIRSLKQQGVIASIGHTNATYEETEAAISAGCTHATHLFNAMSGLHQREPGASLAVLLANEVSAEIIADGIHVHPAMIHLVSKLKSNHQLILVTDAMRAKCLGNGKYDLGGQTVIVEGQRASLEDGTLAGSVLRLPEAIQNMKHITDCSVIDAINMASLNPAHLLGLEQHKGSISVGKDADLVVFDENWTPTLTFREGQMIFTKNNIKTYLA